MATKPIPAPPRAVYAYAESARFARSTRANPSTSSADRSKAYALQHGLTLTEIFVEEGVSGSIPVTERPAGGALLAKLERGDVIIAAKLDRNVSIGRWTRCRSPATFKQRGVGLHLLDLGGDINNGPQQIVFHDRQRVRRSRARPHPGTNLPKQSRTRDGAVFSLAASRRSATRRAKATPARSSTSRPNRRRSPRSSRCESGASLAELSRRRSPPRAASASATKRPHDPAGAWRGSRPWLSAPGSNGPIRRSLLDRLHERLARLRSVLRGAARDANTAGPSGRPRAAHRTSAANWQKPIAWDRNAPAFSARARPPAARLRLEPQRRLRQPGRPAMGASICGRSSDRRRISIWLLLASDLQNFARFCRSIGAGRLCELLDRLHDDPRTSTIAAGRSWRRRRPRCASSATSRRSPRCAWPAAGPCQIGRSSVCEAGMARRVMPLQWARDVLAAASGRAACFVKQLSGRGGAAINRRGALSARSGVRQISPAKRPVRPDRALRSSTCSRSRGPQADAGGNSATAWRRRGKLATCEGAPPRGGKAMKDFSKGAGTRQVGACRVFRRRNEGRLWRWVCTKADAIKPLRSILSVWDAQRNAQVPSRSVPIP